ncbi:ABC transporter ATP-binding protein [Mycoplasma struthionis]|uniref:ABC transporter ATP-binding protein n=1 Tax=Mycoplasma struthionis TaxID=538220 RepID=UPI002FE25751
MIKYLNAKKGTVFWIIVTTFLASFSLTAGVFGLGYFTDTFLTKDFLNNNFDMLKFGGFFGLIIFLYLLQLLFSYISTQLTIKSAMLTAKIMRLDAYKAIMKMPISFFDSINNGELMSILSNDIENITSGLNGSLNAIISSVATTLTSLAFMLYYSSYLTIITISFFFGSLIVAYFLMKKATPQFAKTQKRIATLNGFIEENLSAHHLINSYQRQEVINKEFEIKNQKLFKSSFKGNLYSGLIYPYGNAISNILQLLTVAFAFVFAFNNIGTGSGKKFQAGIIISFIIYVRIMSNQIIRTFENINAMQIASVSASRVIRLINLKPEVNEDLLKTIDSVSGEVEFKNVDFSYNKSSDTLQLKNANFKANKGQVFAIVGPTGAGKTTIINLLSKFYLPNKGQVLIDNHSSTEINEKSWRNHISIVLQDTFLFKTTILENLRYANPNATDEEIQKAARISSADDFIQQLQNGYNEIVEEGGENFSQGERQLLAITRAIIANKNILILDEATSNVDTRTEKLIQAAMLELMKGKTSFVIAHRLSTIVNADQILVIKDGEIIERGTHAELLKLNQFYAKLYNSSFDEDA